MDGTGVPIVARVTSRPVPGGHAGTGRDVWTMFAGRRVAHDDSVPVRRPCKPPAASTRNERTIDMRSRSMFIPAFVAIVATASLPGRAAFASGPEHGHQQEPRLLGRAVLPAETLAPGPPSGAALTTTNGITFPLPSQPVEGFSAIIDGRTPR